MICALVLHKKYTTAAIPLKVVISLVLHLLLRCYLRCCLRCYLRCCLRCYLRCCLRHGWSHGRSHTVDFLRIQSVCLYIVLTAIYPEGEWHSQSSITSHVPIFLPPLRVTIFLSIRAFISRCTVRTFNPDN